MGESAADPKAKKSANMRLLVATASKDEVQWYRAALLAAKLRAETMELPALCVVNAFQRSHPEVCAKEVVLLLDIGARATSLNFLRGGEPVMTRLVDYGGTRISEYISQVLALPAGEAEAAKRAFADEIQPLVQASLFLLGREIRSSIDFFERQHECHVAKAFAGGGTACGPGLLSFLGESAGAHIEAWNPVHEYHTDGLAGAAELPALAPVLGAALGVAVAHLSEE
jgi:type IV pilus assembly protein PilM